VHERYQHFICLEAVHPAFFCRFAFAKARRHTTELLKGGVRGGQPAALKFTVPRNLLKTEIYQGSIGKHFKGTQMGFKCPKSLKNHRVIFFANLSAVRLLAECILKLQKRPRGALERVLANFFAQTGKITKIIQTKKHSNHTR
jgi:hypothetical protein